MSEQWGWVLFPLQAQKEAASLRSFAETSSGHLLYAEHRARWGEGKMGRRRAHPWRGDKAQSCRERLEEDKIPGQERGWERGRGIVIQPRGRADKLMPGTLTPDGME